MKRATIRGKPFGLGHAALVLLSMFSVPARVSWGQAYVVTDLGTLGGPSSAAYDINESGRVVGWAKNAGDPNFPNDPAYQYKRGFLYEDGVMSGIGTLGGDESWAYGVNESGQIAGEALAFGALNFKRAFFWEDGVMTDLGTLGGPYAFAWDINDVGQVVGSAAPDQFQGQAFLWQDGVMTDLGTLGGNSSYAYGINNAGQVVGWARYTTNTKRHAFLWQSGVMTDLGTFGGTLSEGWDINQAGQVVGWAETSSGAWHAFKWESGVLSDLGTLGGTHSLAYGINDRGAVVGKSYTEGDPGTYAAFLWDGEALVNLNSLIDPNLGWVLNQGRSINNLGQIVGAGTIDGESHAFLMTPIYALTVTEYNEDLGDVVIDPEPNDVNAPAFLAGTEVTLTAEPIEGKSFSHWLIYDANHPGDSNYAAEDSNDSIVITMDADRAVQARFSCASGLAPILPVSLVGLGAGLVRRRRRS